VVDTEEVLVIKCITEQSLDRIEGTGECPAKEQDGLEDEVVGKTIGLQDIENLDLLQHSFVCSNIPL